MWTGSVGFTESPSVELSVGMSVRQPRMLEAFLRGDLLEGLAHQLAPLGVARHEQHADAVLAGLRQREAELLRLAREELVRDLHQDAGAVAGARIGADRAAMLEVEQDGQRILDDLVRLAALDVGDEADAAGILVERGIVEAVASGSAGIGAVAIEQARVDAATASPRRRTLPLRVALFLILALSRLRSDRTPAHQPRPQHRSALRPKANRS